MPRPPPGRPATLKPWRATRRQALPKRLLSPGPSQTPATEITRTTPGKHTWKEHGHPREPWPPQPDSPVTRGLTKPGLHVPNAGKACSDDSRQPGMTSPLGNLTDAQPHTAWPTPDPHRNPAAVQHKHQVPGTAARPRVRALCEAFPSRSPSCLRGCARSAPPPCSRPHPLIGQQGEVGNTTALLHEQTGRREDQSGNALGETRNPPAPNNHGPIPGFPQTPIPASPDKRNAPR